MKRSWIWIRWIILATMLLLVLAALLVLWSSQSRLTRTYSVSPAQLTLTTDAATIERGRHVATIRGCVECHGRNLGGRVFLDEPMIGRFVASNLTRGKGGVGTAFSDDDWIRAIRHGVRPNGKALLLMPSEEFYHLSDEDLAAVIAYTKSVPPVDNVLPVSSVSLMGRVLITVDRAINLISAERIDHAAARPIAPAIGATIEYGRYLGTSCTGCHGSAFSGGKIPGAPPDWPAAPNLTPAPGAAISRWSVAEFSKSMRTGVTPEGRKLDARYMPWNVLGQMTDDEMQALWLYLRSISPKPTGNR